MNNKEIVTPISYDCKRLLLEVLTHGYITDEQKTSLANFFNVEKIQMVYVSSPANLDEIKNIYEEVKAEAERKRIPSPLLAEINNETMIL